MKNKILNGSKMDYLLILIKSLQESSPQKIIGKTIIQKLMYLLYRENIGGFNFTLYHYGPYSSELADYLAFSDYLNFTNISWNEYKGYDIKIAKEKELKIKEKEKKKIIEIVNKYGIYNAGDLSIIATAYYLLDTFKIPKKKVVSEINRIKPKFSEEYIQTTLGNANVL